MEIIEKQSSSEIARFLREKILSGSYPAGKSLKSLRALAEEFGVSRQVIHSALNQLAAENLVESRPRKGYLVCDTTNTDVKGMFLLAALQNSEVNSYVKQLMNVLCPPYLPRGYNSWCRLLNYENSSSWLQELSRIETMTGINVLLVYKPQITEAELEKTLQMPFQVIFLGDFEDEKNYSDSTCNITNDATMNIDLCYDYISNLPGDGDIGLIGFSRDIFYINEYFETAASKAEARKLALQTFNLPYSFQDESENAKIKLAEDLVKQLPENLKCLYFAGVEYEYFKEAVAKFRPGIPVLGTNNTSKEIPHIQADFSPFLMKTVELIRKIEKGEDISGRHKIQLDSKICIGN